MRTHITIRLLLLFGIFLTISSAMISNNFVQGNVQKIKKYKDSQSKIDMQISGLWQKQTLLEQKLDTAALLQAMGKDKEFTNDFFISIEKQINSHNKVNGTKSANHNILKKDFESFKDETMQRINKLFLEKVKLEEQITKLNSDIYFYFNIAILVHMLGLILILSKDFFITYKDGSGLSQENAK